MARMCSSSTTFLKQEERDKQIMNVNVLKHKAFQGNYHALPGTVDSLREVILMCFILANKRQKTDISRCTRAELPSSKAVAYSSTACVYEPRNLLITTTILLEDFSVVSHGSRHIYSLVFVTIQSAHLPL